MECKYEENIEIWKIQRMIKNLANARENGIHDIISNASYRRFT